MGKNATYQRKRRACTGRRENLKLSEETLLRLGKLRFPNIPAAIFWNGGKEMTVVGINWASLTNDEIVNYFRK
jgi:hypothetical protein